MGATWVSGLVAVPLGVLFPAYLVALLLVLQVTSEPDLIGGYEGLDGFVSLVFGVPAGILGALLGTVLGRPWRRRFRFAVIALQVLLIALGVADMYGYELVR